MSSFKKKPYALVTPPGSEAEPLSGAGLVPKVTGVGRAAAAAGVAARVGAHATAASDAAVSGRMRARIRTVLMGGPALIWPPFRRPPPELYATGIACQGMRCREMAVVKVSVGPGCPGGRP